MVTVLTWLIFAFSDCGLVEG
ncbi:hypothetical protein CP02DC14_2110A, partial [Chlamydia psittaci 02DC14]